MPKAKTHSGTAKRVKITGSGLIKIKRTNMRHLMRKKGKRQKRALNIDSIVKPCNDHQFRVMMKLKAPRKQAQVILISEEEFAALQAIQSAEASK